MYMRGMSPTRDRASRELTRKDLPSTVIPSLRLDCRDVDVVRLTRLTVTISTATTAAPLSTPTATPSLMRPPSSPSGSVVARPPSSSVYGLRRVGVLVLLLGLRSVVPRVLRRVRATLGGRKRSG
jgi:hypothetical protein